MSDEALRVANNRIRELTAENEELRAGVRRHALAKTRERQRVHEPPTLEALVVALVALGAERAHAEDGSICFVGPREILLLPKKEAT